MELRDQLGRRMILPGDPGRIISLVPSQTELIVDLGLQKELVGITKFCVHPSGLRKSTRIVGGTKQVHPEKIRLLGPDIILCNKEENTPEMVRELEKIAPVHVSDILGLNDVFVMMRQYGQLFGRERRAEEFIASIAVGFEKFREEMLNRPRMKVAYVIWKDPLMVAGRETFINYLLEMNNFSNIFPGRYPKITLEALHSQSPDLVLLSSEPFPFAEKHIASFRGSGEIRLVDGEFFSWYGSRLLKALDYFKDFRDSVGR